jgi:hypothetical protein
VRTLAKQARHVLGSPRQRAHALRRHNHLERRFHGRWGRGVARPHLRYGRAPQGAAPRYGRVYGRAGAEPGAAPGTYYSGGTVAAPAGRTGARTGSTVGGQCACSACPTCGAPAATQPAPTVTATPAPAPVPAYCRCCGQVIR